MLYVYFFLFFPIFQLKSSATPKVDCMCVCVFSWKSWLGKCRCSERSWGVETRPLLSSHCSVNSYNNNISGNKWWVGVNRTNKVKSLKRGLYTIWGKYTCSVTIRFHKYIVPLPCVWEDALKISSFLCVYVWELFLLLKSLVCCFKGTKYSFL